MNDAILFVLAMIAAVYVLSALVAVGNLALGSLCRWLAGRMR